MKRFTLALCLGTLALLFVVPTAAAVELESFDFVFENEDGSFTTQAGSHPYALKVTFAPKTKEGGGGKEVPEAPIKDIDVTQIEGFAGNPTAVPPCSALDFLTLNESFPGGFIPECADSSAVGIIRPDVRLEGKGHESFKSPLYDLEAPQGAAAKLGFWVSGVPVTVEVGVSEEPPYRVIARSRNISQVLEFFGAELTIWGNPASPIHDEERGGCYLGSSADEKADPKCSAVVAEEPFLTAPRACLGPLETNYALDSWEEPGEQLENGEPNLFDPAWTFGGVLTHDEVGNPQGFSGCGKLSFSPQFSATPSTTDATSAAGIDVSLDVNDPGLTSPTGTAASDIRAAEVRFPQGVTLNPSAAEGLGVCTLEQYEEASLTNPGCPDSAKLGSIEVQTPILEGKTLKGSLYLAAQDDPETTEEGKENPFDSLFALYMLIRSPELGVFVAQAGAGETDEASGQVITSFEDIPQFPLSHIGVHLRSGPRAPFITPPLCDADPSTPEQDPYTTTATLYPWSGGAPLKATSSFEITAGPGGDLCPPQVPPFAPHFEAGAVNNAAGHYSPFDMRITRQDSEQDLTRFSAALPPGVVAKIAGVGKCSDQAIEQAKAKSGRAELASPSCPASSQIGHVLGGAGVGEALTYVPGSLYLAGPFNGDPLSVVSIVPAVAGPFDVGTIVTRVALTLNPITYQAEVDGSASDPIPHMLKGIPLKVRDLQVFVDRPEFMLNATSCEPMTAIATLTGSGADPFSPSDDTSAQAPDRYQAASCASLAFKPKLSLRLKGATNRGGHPALHSVLTPRAGDANIKRAVITLPHTEFIDQAHINNPCTRVQFNAGACPKASVLGHAKAITPLLDESLEGPVYFRSNGGERKLPDIVIDLNGAFHVILVGFVDSKNARIRTTFATAPDAPATRLSVDLFGGKRGLLENSADLCAAPRHVKLALTAQNGRRALSEPVIETSCGKKRWR
jgi:hypothetical protein